MNILEAWRQRKIRRAFSKYITPELVEKALAAEQSGHLGENKIRHFQFMVVHIAEAAPDEVPKAITNVVDIFLRQSATVLDITSSLVIGCFGVPYPKDDSVEARLNLVAALLAENGNRVRVAHGECNGMTGNFGTKGRWNFGVIIPNFSTVLKKLFETEFGAAVEIA